MRAPGEHHFRLSYRIEEGDIHNEQGPNSVDVVDGNRRWFGHHACPGASSRGSMPLPEPSSLTLLVTAAAGLLIAARFIRRR